MQKRGRIRNRAVIVARDTFAFQKSMANEQESPEVLRAPLALSKNGSIQADPIDPGYLLHCGLGAVGLAVARAECRAVRKREQNPSGLKLLPLGCARGRPGRLS